MVASRELTTFQAKLSRVLSMKPLSKSRSLPFLPKIKMLSIGVFLSLLLEIQQQNSQSFQQLLKNGIQGLMPIILKLMILKYTLKRD